uniref:Uncharacterized protein n=1 Tax=Arundo donax TaxID=35708 RepID=A0A0A9HSC0_ARUDO
MQDKTGKDSPKHKHYGRKITILDLTGNAQNCTAMIRL